MVPFWFVSSWKFDLYVIGFNLYVKYISCRYKLVMMVFKMICDYSCEFSWMVIREGIACSTAFLFHLCFFFLILIPKFPNTLSIHIVVCWICVLCNYMLKSNAASFLLLLIRHMTLRFTHFYWNINMPSTPYSLKILAGTRFHIPSHTHFMQTYSEDTSDSGILKKLEPHLQQFGGRQRTEPMCRER